jgi:hypothetical protein
LSDGQDAADLVTESGLAGPEVVGMAEWPNVLVPNKIGPFLDYVRRVNKPPKVTQEWLASGGFTSSADRGLLTLIKSLGYADGSGAPTDKWGDLKRSESDRKASIGWQMAVAYPEVFQNFPIEEVRDTLTKDDLRNFVRPKITAGAPTVDNIVSTFFALKALASFGAEAVEQPARAAGALPAPAPALPLSPGPQPAASGQGLSVTINLSLEIPQTTDPDVYDKLFEAMAKHLGTLLKRGS